MENFDFMQNIRWEFVALSVFCVFNLILLIKSRAKIAALEKSQAIDNKHLLELAGDIKALYESGTTMGRRLKSLEYGAKMLKEEQEQLSLKEPSQQMYRNAVQLINSGESVNKISKSSGLSRGEVELLKLFQRIETESKNDSVNHTAEDS